MNKILEFFKKIPDSYYNWKKRNENLSKFLEKEAVQVIEDLISKG